MIVYGIRAERSRLHEHQLFPAVPSNASRQAACSWREHSNSSVDVHEIISGCCWSCSMQSP